MKVATLFRFGMATALLVAATAVGFADVKHVFNKGDVVSSGQMNENFADLDQRIASPTRVATIGTVSYSVGATNYCGSTDPRTGSFDANGNGYAAAKSACEAKCMTKTAHMCSSEEMVRLAQMGAATGTGTGWISTGVAATTPGPTAVCNDCGGWSTAVGTTDAAIPAQQFGSAWTGRFIGFVGCNSPLPIICCD